MAEATDVRMCPFRTDFCSRDRCKARRMRNDNNNKYNNRTKSIHLASSSIFSFNGLFLAFLRVSNGAAHKLKIPCDYYFWLCRVAFQQFVILLWIIIVRKFSNFFFLLLFNGFRMTWVIVEKWAVSFDILVGVATQILFIRRLRHTARDTVRGMPSWVQLICQQHSRWATN